MATWKKVGEPEDPEREALSRRAENLRDNLVIFSSFVTYFRDWSNQGFDPLPLPPQRSLVDLKAYRAPIAEYGDVKWLAAGRVREYPLPSREHSTKEIASVISSKPQRANCWREELVVFTHTDSRTFADVQRKPILTRTESCKRGLQIKTRFGNSSRDVEALQMGSDVENVTPEPTFCLVRVRGRRKGSDTGTTKNEIPPMLNEPENVILVQAEADGTKRVVTYVRQTATRMRSGDEIGSKFDLNKLRSKGYGPRPTTPPTE